MSSALLSIIRPDGPDEEFEIGDETVSLGRALDNTIPLQDDTNVSRYHAEIEKRAQGFFVVDLGSSNGTTLNDSPVEFEHELHDGDLICLGGSTLIQFRLRPPKPAEQSPSQKPEPVTDNPTPMNLPDPAAGLSAGAGAHIPAVSVPAAPATGGPPILLIIGGIAGGLILTTVVALLIIAFMSRGSCNASIKIASPQSGSTLRGPTPVRLDVQDSQCIEKVIYRIDGTEVASKETSPYDIVLDPGQLRNLGTGTHSLSVSVEDTKGAITVEETLLFAFETAAENSATPPVGQTSDNSNQVTTQDVNVDIRSLSDRLAGQISRKSGYIFDRDFVELIRVRSGEYRTNGYTDKARQYRREINKAFRDQGLDPLVGYVLAMSRSKFNENARGEGIGLWQIPLSVAQGYLNSGETESALRDPKRSAEIAAVYTKALINTFESTDDFMFAVACFGSPITQAGQVRTQLATLAPDPLARRDFFKMVKLGVVKGDQVDRVVRFFAAGIVAENPQAFGMQNDQPFSSLF